MLRLFNLKRFKTLLAFLIGIFLLLTSVSNAAVDLFDRSRGQPAPVKEPTKKPLPKPKPKPVKAEEVDLMLVGVTQLGMTTLHFKNKKSKQVSLKLKPQENSSLPGYEDLIVDKIENRVLYVKDVNKKYCKSNEKKGITCKPGDGILEMRLVRKHVASKKPLPVQQKPKPKPRSSFGGGPDTRPRKKKTGVTRIKEEDVPAGMRLIRSPFGDRLVPKKS